MSHFLYVKLMGLMAICDGLIMLTLGARFASCQYSLCLNYTRWQAQRAKDALAAIDQLNQERPA